MTDTRSHDARAPETEASVPRAADPITQEYLTRIAHGEIAPGSELPSEGELAIAHGVSRTTIRQAMHFLAARGFVTQRRGARARVAPEREWKRLDPDYLRVLLGSGRFPLVMEARGILEPSIAAMAASRISAAQLVQLERVHNRMRSHAENVMDDRAKRAFSTSDLAFHSLLAEACGNAVIQAMYEGVVGVGLEVRLASAEVEGSPARAVAWHDAVLRAVQARNPAAARDAMAEHMVQVAHELEQVGLYPVAMTAQSENGPGVPAMQ